MTEAGGRVLLLDVDGVLVTPPEMFGQRLFRDHPEVAAEFFSGPFVDASCGRLDLRDVLPPYLERFGYADTLEQFLLEWFGSENHPNLPILTAVRELRALGWPTFLATNQERHRVRYLLEEMKLGELVDGEFSSASIGARKPDAPYFVEVTRRLNIPPAQIMFWDDVQANVDAAAGAGWQAHLFMDAAQFRAVMELPLSAQPSI
ncbi:HAD family phosphatase [Deinococcus rubellus]